MKLTHKRHIKKTHRTPKKRSSLAKTKRRQPKKSVGIKKKTQRKRGGHPFSYLFNKFRTSKETKVEDSGTESEQEQEQEETEPMMNLKVFMEEEYNYIKKYTENNFLKTYDLIEDNKFLKKNNEKIYETLIEKTNIDKIKMHIVFESTQYLTNPDTPNRTVNDFLKNYESAKSVDDKYEIFNNLKSNYNSDESEVTL
jgi:hypothetical protein